jgi:hypothetical protein
VPSTGQRQDSPWRATPTASSVDIEDVVRVGGGAVRLASGVGERVSG